MICVHLLICSVTLLLPVSLIARHRTISSCREKVRTGRLLQWQTKQHKIAVAAVRKKHCWDTLPFLQNSREPSPDRWSDLYMRFPMEAFWEWCNLVPLPCHLIATYRHGFMHSYYNINISLILSCSSNTKKEFIAIDIDINGKIM